MTDNAIAVTVFHSVPDAAGFDAWLPELIESATQAQGFVAASPSVHDDEQLDWALGVSFSDGPSLTDWLDSPGRRACRRDLLLALVSGERGLGISVRGAVAMVILYAVILAVFANVTWLEYWRH